MLLPKTHLAGVFIYGFLRGVEGASTEEMTKTWNNQTISYELKDNAIVLTFDSSDSDKSSQKTLYFEYDGTINVTSVAKNDKDPHSIEQGALVIKRR